MEQNRKKITLIVKEIGKWALAFWLVWPITQGATSRMSFYRIMLGILLFILFIGKMFYDIIIESYHKREHPNKFIDFFVMVGSVTFIALVIAAAIVITGLMVYEMASDAAKEPTGLENMQ